MHDCMGIVHFIVGSDGGMDCCLRWQHLHHSYEWLHGKPVHVCTVVSSRRFMERDESMLTLHIRAFQWPQDILSSFTLPLVQIGGMKCNCILASATWGNPCLH